MRKGEVEIILKKNGTQDITITCPEKIKLSTLMTFAVIQYGLPPMNIKPIDKKGLIITIVAFLSIFLVCGFFTISSVLGFLLLIVTVTFNFIYTKNYFFNYIKKRLAEGYIPATKETSETLQKVGLQLKETGSRDNAVDNSSVKEKRNDSSRDVIEELEKLHNLMEKGILSKEEFDIQKAKLLENK